VLLCVRLTRWVSSIHHKVVLTLGVVVLFSVLSSNLYSEICIGGTKQGGPRMAPRSRRMKCPIVRLGIVDHSCGLFRHSFSTYNVRSQMLSISARTHCEVRYSGLELHEGSEQQSLTQILPPNLPGQSSFRWRSVRSINISTNAHWAYQIGDARSVASGVNQFPRDSLSLLGDIDVWQLKVTATNGMFRACEDK